MRLIPTLCMAVMLAVAAIPVSASEQAVGARLTGESRTRSGTIGLLDASPFTKPLMPDPALTERARWTVPRDVHQAAAPSRRHAVAWGIVAGAIGGAALAGVAAEVYGGNEGGSCSRCFVQWAAFTVPAGAAVGAIVGVRDRPVLNPGRKSDRSSS